MSTIGERLAWLESVRAGSPAAKAILFALVTHCDGAWVCWPSVETIAETSEASVGHVRRCLSEWEADGRITRTARWASDGGGRRSSVTTIQPDAWQTIPRMVRDHTARERAYPPRMVRDHTARERASEPSLEPPLEPRDHTAHHARFAPGSGVIGQRSNCPTCDGTGFTLDADGNAVVCQQHYTHTDNDASEEAVAEHPPIDEARKALRRLAAVEDSS